MTVLELRCNSLGKHDFFGCDPRSIGERFDTRFYCSAQPAAVLWIDFVGRPEITAIASLDDEDHGGPMAFFAKPHQLFEVLCAALAHGIREGCGTINGKGHVLNLNETEAGAAAFETQIQAGTLDSDDLTTNGMIALRPCGSDEEY